MTIKNADLPAMPIPLEDGSVFNYHGPADGLTKREYFAGLAMQAIIAHPHGPAGAWDKAAKDSVLAADALLAELEKSNDN